jgi:hypothetical protein
MRAVALAFGSVVLVGVAALAITLSHAPIAVARFNSYERLALGSLRQSGTICQADEVLPAGTSAVRLQLFALTGPRVTLAVLAGGRTIAHGERAAGWTGGSVTVPLSHVSGARTGVTLCFALALNGDERVTLTGARASAALAAQFSSGPLPGRIDLEDLRPGQASWWSLLLAVARRMGLGRGAAGTWWALLAAALMLGVALISARVVLTELR